MLYREAQRYDCKTANILRVGSKGAFAADRMRLPLSLWLGIVFCTGAVAVAWAEPTGGTGKLLQKAERLREEGLAALLAKDAQAACAKLVESYRLSREPRTLCMLARATKESGQLLAAQDYARRCLADPALDAGDSEREPALKLQEQPRPDSGELLAYGPPGSVLRIDGRFVGVLPLLLPVLLSTGEHEVVLEGNHKPVHSPVVLPRGRGVVIRIKPDSNAAVVTVLPSVLEVAEFQELPKEAAEAAEQAVSAALNASGLSRFDLDAASRDVPEGRQCRSDEACQRRLAKKNEVEYILNLRIVAPKAGTRGAWQFSAALRDPELLEPAAQAQEDCDSCSAPDAIALLRRLLERVLTQGRERASGAFAVLSAPAGAEVFLDGLASGRTPVKARAWSGTHELELRLHGHKTDTRQLVVDEIQPTTLQVELQAQAEPTPPPAVPPAPPPPPLRRRPWALATGAAFLGVGAVLVGLSGYGFAINGTCLTAPVPPMTECRTLNDTIVSGSALAAAGGAAMLTGIVLIALPPRVYIRRH
jgi:hypothetical protein